MGENKIKVRLIEQYEIHCPVCDNYQYESDVSINDCITCEACHNELLVEGFDRLVNFNEEELEHVASFILEESQKPIDEIKWLIKMAYGDDTPTMRFKDAWTEVLADLKE